MDRDTRNLVRKVGRKAFGGRGTKPYTTYATVRSNGVRPSVLVDGAESPVQAEAYMGARRGDRVLVEVSSSGVRVVGNQSSPATDDRTAERANAFASRSMKMAEGVKETVDGAYDKAGEALTLASSASTIVEGMSERVDQAVIDAAAAKEVADGVDAQVSAAVTAAGEASALATEASEAAGIAKQDARDAIDYATAVEQTVYSLNVRTTVGDDESLVRAHMGGVLVGKVGQSPCAFVSNEGEFDVVDIEWVHAQQMDEHGRPVYEDGEPVKRWEPVVKGRSASFGLETVLEGRDQFGVVRHVTRMTPDAMEVENLEASSYFKLGRFAWKPRLSGGLTLQWIGG